MKRKIYLIIAILLIATLFLVGCQKEEKISYQDGFYTAELEMDERGWQPTIKIKVENGKIIEVHYDEINEEGISKADLEEYSQNMEAVSGIAPREAFEKLQAALIEKQKISDVDVVTGATSSTSKFKEVAEKAFK